MTSGNFEIYYKLISVLGIERRTSTVVNIVTEESVRVFGQLSGDLNPLHFDKDFAEKSLFGKKIAHGLLSFSFGSAALYELGTPKETVVLLEILNVKFKRPVEEGDEITTTAEIISSEGVKKTVDCKWTNQKGELVINGTFVVKIYSRKKEETKPVVEIVAHLEEVKKADVSYPPNGSISWRK